MDEQGYPPLFLCHAHHRDRRIFLHRRRAGGRSVMDDDQGYSPFFYMAMLVLAIAALGMCSVSMIFAY